MNRRNKLWAAALWSLALASAVIATFGPHFVTAEVTGDAQNALMGRTDKVQRYDLAIKAVPAPAGAYTNAVDAAAHEWHPGTYRPYRPDGPPHATGIGPDGYLWPILAYYKDNRKPLVVWYWGGSFRSSNGGNWGIPERWAYIRYYQEVWDPIAKQGRIPGLDPAIEAPPVPPQAGPLKPTPKSLRYVIDGLKMRYTTGELNQAIDESLYNEPSEGAPEDGGGAPL